MMETQTKLRGALEWTGIILFVAVGGLLLQWPLTRPWLLAALGALILSRIAYVVYQLARRQRDFGRATREHLVTLAGVMCLLANMVWDRPLLSLGGLLLMMGPIARAWHEHRRISDPSGPIAR